MTNFNPYAPPKADISDDDKHAGIYLYSKDTLFIPHEKELPNRCVKCNELASVKKTQRFNYNAYPMFLSFIVAAIILMIVGLIQYFGLLLFLFILCSLFTQKKSKLSLGLCQKHNQQRWVVGMACVIGQILAFVLLFKFAGQAIFLLFISLIFMVLLFTMSYYWRLATVSKIDNDGIYLKSLGKPFLQSFEQNSVKN